MSTQLGYGALDLGFVNPYPAEDLSSYVGHAVYENGSGKWALASSSSQAATGLLGFDEFAGVIVEGGETDEPITVAYCGQGYQPGMIAGTGGVTKGDFVIGEYAASGTDRGRFVTASVLTPGMFVYGVAMETASEDGEFTIDLNQSFKVTEFWSAAPTEITASANVVATVAQMLTGEIRIDGGGSARDVTTPTASALITEMDARGITRFQVVVTNTADDELTLAAGSGVTGVTNGADLILEEAEQATLFLAKTGAAAVALLVSKGANS